MIQQSHFQIYIYPMEMKKDIETVSALAFIVFLCSSTIYKSQDMETS